MSTFQDVFAQRAAFVGYVTAGHGGMDYTKQAALALVAGGVDILEVGVPFSDPVADGPTIQQAMVDALEHQVHLSDVLGLVAEIHNETAVPVVLFSYFNPLLSMGVEKALQAAAAAGVQGVLVVDLPFEESETYFAQCRQAGLAPIGLISPSTSDERIKMIDQACDGFLYYVCRNGTTGVQNALPDDYVANMQRIQSLATTPVVSGFGIGNRELAGQAVAHANGFVVGSAFVRAMSQNATPSELTALAQQIDPR